MEVNCTTVFIGDSVAVKRAGDGRIASERRDRAAVGAGLIAREVRIDGE